MAKDRSGLNSSPVLNFQFDVTELLLGSSFYKCCQLLRDSNFC